MLSNGVEIPQDNSEEVNKIYGEQFAQTEQEKMFIQPQPDLKKYNQTSQNFQQNSSFNKFRPPSIKSQEDKVPLPHPSPKLSTFKETDEQTVPYESDRQEEFEELEEIKEITLLDEEPVFKRDE